MIFFIFLKIYQNYIILYRNYIYLLEYIFKNNSNIYISYIFIIILCSKISQINNLGYI